MRRLHAELAQQRAELADLYDRAPCGYCSLSADGTVLRINDTGLAWLGYQRQEIVGQRRLADLMAPGDRAALQRYWRVLTSRASVSDVEAGLVRRDGAVLPVSLNITSVRDAEGALIEVRSTIVDITARKQAEDALRRSRDALGRANDTLLRESRAKDEFLAAMSHELRTPLNAVLGLSEALQEGVYGHVPERQQLALRRIEESGRHLLSLISDILDLAKIDAGKVELDLTPVSVEDLCRGSLRLVHEAATKKRIETSLHRSARAASLVGDERRLKQVLVNLLSNAVKFTPEGGLVGLDVESDEVSDAIRFTVRDTGIGIARADLSRAFQAFVQLDSSLARRYAGTGLGLALVHKLVRLHGGGMAVESEPGLGSRFTVIIPRSPPAREVGPPLGRPSLAVAAARVLIARGDDVGDTTLDDALRSHGHEVVVGGAAHDLLRQAHDVEPDVVLMDVQMPSADDLATLESLRAGVVAGLGAAPVVVLTALDVRGDRERAAAAGASAYLTRPVDPRAFVAIIEGLLGPRPSRAP